MARSRWLSVVIGAVAVLVGWGLLFRPFASLTVLLLLVVLGLVTMAAAAYAEAPAPRRRVDLLPAAAYALAALAVVAWPGAAVVVLVWAVAASLAVDGAVALVRAVTEDGPGRLTGALRGAACLVLAVLAVTWPDLASIVVAVVFGVRLLWAGLRLVWQGASGRPVGETRSAGPAPWWRRSISFVVAAASLAVAVALAGLGSLVSDSTPVPDGFYSAPQDVPAEPGALLRTADFDRDVPDGARAWRILYTSTALDDEQALASAILVVPDDAGEEPLPLVAWAHGTTGVAEGCAPSLLDDPFEAGAMFTHAPDAGVVGVAAMAPASNLTGLIANLDEVTAGSIFASYVLDGYARTYDDVEVRDYVRGAAQVQVEEMATRCLSGPGALVNVGESLVQDTSIFDTDPTTGALGARIAENIPTDPIEAPLLLAQGETDPLVIPSAQQEYADQRCSSGGGPVDYRTYADRDRVDVVADDSPLVPELLDWTAERFAGQPADDTCG